VDTKLTLKLDRAVIRRAKTYARKRNSSLSSLVEVYFRSLTGLERTPDGKGDGHTPIVAELAGLLELPAAGWETKDEYAEYLTRKYR
jgi:hypothetical protein